MHRDHTHQGMVICFSASTALELPTSYDNLCHVILSFVYDSRMLCLHILIVNATGHGNKDFLYMYSVLPVSKYNQCPSFCMPGHQAWHAEDSTLSTCIEDKLDNSRHVISIQTALYLSRSFRATRHGNSSLTCNENHRRHFGIISHDHSSPMYSFSACTCLVIVIECITMWKLPHCSLVT